MCVDIMLTEWSTLWINDWHVSVIPGEAVD